MPSRQMPPLCRKPFGWPAALGVGAFALGLGYCIYSASTVVQCMTALFVCACYVDAMASSRREARRFQALARCRKGESICGFVRSFDTRLTDTWVIRATHQELQLFLRSYLPAFPIRASDSVLDDLRLDPEDLDDLLVDIAERSGRSVDTTDDNPYYGKVKTVMDMVLFINTQPVKG